MCLIIICVLYSETACPEGTHGEDCKNECNCANTNNKCDPKTGQCLCPSYTSGNDCKEGRYIFSLNN